MPVIETHIFSLVRTLGGYLSLSNHQHHNNHEPLFVDLQSKPVKLACLH